MDGTSTDDFARARARMVKKQLTRRDITDLEVLRALGLVPRHEFVLPSDWDEAYDDHPIGIGCRQTISQPYIVAYMTQALRVKPEMRVLEIGTGSGYQTAVLAELGAVVYTVERHEPLQEQAIARLERLGYGEKIHFRVGDGTLGWPGEVPFERIIVTASAPQVPLPLQEQLADGGRMVIPVGGELQSLRIVSRQGESFRNKKDMGVIFVKLIGKEGFPE